VCARFIYPLRDEMHAMLRLPLHTVFMHIDLDESGEIVGLF